jgi:hypothetical protein
MTQPKISRLNSPRFNIQHHHSKMKITISILATLVFLLGFALGQSTNSSATDTGSARQALTTSTETAPETEPSGVRGSETGSLTGAFNSTVIGSTSIFETTNGATIGGLTTVPTSASASATVAASSSSASQANRMEIIWGGKIGVLFGMAMCLVAGFFVLA